MFFLFFGVLTSKILLFNIKFMKHDLYNLNILKKIFYVLIFVSIVGLVLIYMKLFSQYSFFDFVLKQQIIKTNADRSRFGTYMVLFSYVLIPISNFLFYHKKIKRKILFIPLLISFLYGISYWGRYPIMVSIIIFISSYFIMNSSRLKNKLTLKKVSIIIIILMVLFTLSYVFLSWTIELRIRTYGPGYGYKVGDINHKFLGEIIGESNIFFGSLRGFVFTYSYLVSPIYTLDHWLKTEVDFSFGSRMFPYFYRIFTSKSYRMPKVGTGLQLPTFIGYSYLDFGYLGIIFYSYLLGFLSFMFYKISLNKALLTGVLFYPIMVAFLLMTPFISYSFQTLFIIQIFYSMLILFLIRIRL
jgi:hypothetical protein